MTFSRSHLAVLFLGFICQVVVQVTAEEQYDERRPSCPAECNISMDQVNSVVAKINGRTYRLTDDSCQEFDKLGDGFFKLYYQKPETDDPNIVHRRQLQSINGQMSPGGGGGMPPPPGFQPTKFGWSIELVGELGSCVTAPGVIAGPFPREELEECIDMLNLACYSMKQESPETCPCFNDNSIEAFINALKSPMSNVVLDLEKSCKKDTEKNDGLPYGLYTKRDPRLRGLRGNSLEFGVGMSSELDENKCYRKYESLDLTAGEHTDCVARIDDFCSKLKTLPKPGACIDDQEYSYHSIPGRTCNNMVTYNPFAWKKRRNCNRYDYDSGKFVFEYCRKSCQKCTCRMNDSTEFRYNGQIEFTCKWLSERGGRRKQKICQDTDVAVHCQNACGTSCCKNSETFRYRKRIDRTPAPFDRQLGKTVRMGCNDINQGTWMDLCKRRGIAVNCPMTCRKCIIQPRT